MSVILGTALNSRSSQGCLSWVLLLLPQTSPSGSYSTENRCLALEHCSLWHQKKWREETYKGCSTCLYSFRSFCPSNYSSANKVHVGFLNKFTSYASLDCNTAKLKSLITDKCLGNQMQIKEDKFKKKPLAEVCRALGRPPLSWMSLLPSDYCLKHHIFGYVAKEGLRDCHTDGWVGMPILSPQ